MTIEKLQFMTEVGQMLEFCHNGTKYNLFYEKDKKGNNIIVFGPQYFEKRYSSFKDLMNNAFVENFYLKAFIESLD